MVSSVIICDCFKVYKSQIPVVESTLDTAALMLGSAKSRGYSLEMIRADFLAGAHIESVKHRIGYALAQEFVCHTDAGGRSFNWSNALAAFTAGGLSNAYYPSTDRGLGLTMSRSAIALLYGSAGGLIQEFWPDIQRKVFHKQPQPAQMPAR